MTLRAGPPRAAGPVHVAVTAGPDPGWIADLTAEEVVLGRGEESTLRIADPLLSRRHVRLRVHRGRVQVRDGGSANGTRVRCGGPWRPVPRGRWLGVPVGARLLAGQTRLEVRGESAPAARSSPGGLGLLPLAFSGATMLLFLTTSGGRGSALRWILLGALVLAITATLLVGRRRRRRRSGRGEDEDRPEPPPLVDPAGALAMAGRPWPVPPRRLEVGPADVRSARGPRRRRRHWASVEIPPAGGGIAVCGPPAEARPLARWLLGQLLLTRDDVAYRAPRAWVPPSPRPEDGAGLVLVLTEDPAAPPRPDAVTIVLCPGPAQAPRWCSRVILAAPEHDRRVSAAWLAHALTLVPGSAGTALPTRALLSAALGPADAAAIRRDWRDPPGDLSAPIGLRVDPDTGLLAPAVIDLAAEGPHALVAGTTGSGKSELLLSWLLALARTHPPEALSLVLVDYKGGATFGPLAGVPHVAGVLTDLDPPGTARALAGLRAEVHRRERLLAQTGSANLGEHLDRLARSGPAAGAARRPGRILLVVDEFRAMSEEHPDVLDELVRLAAQGRSLGLHLVLATQRPGGAVSAEIRANIPVRLCLRVLEEGDSVDVVGDAGAARLPPVPGRLLLRTDGLTEVQSSWVGPPAAGYLGALTAALRAAASPADGAPASGAGAHAYRPWAPDLPERVRLPDFGPAAEPWPAAPSPLDLPLLLVDVDDEQRLGRWHLPAGGLLFVAGGSGSGRSTLAATVVSAALARGVVVHALGRDPRGLGPPGARSPWLGTMGEASDVVLARRLLEILRQTPRERPELLVLDDLVALLRACDEHLAPGAGTELVTDVLRSARANRLGVVVTGELPLPRWIDLVDHRLVLAGRDPDAQLLAGVPKAWTGHAPPGRGTLTTRGRAIRGQVFLPGPPAPDRLPERRPAGPPAPAPLRLRPVPARVDLPAVAPAPAGRVVVGLGGDDASPVCAPLVPGEVLTVVGGPGCGKSTAAATIARRARESGSIVVTDPRRGSPAAGSVLVLDDADRAETAVLDTGTAHLAAGGAVVLTIRADALVGGFHPLLARARDGAILALEAVPAALTRVDVRPWLGPRRPGRGVLVHTGRPVPVQVDLAGRTPADAAPPGGGWAQGPSAP